jgi:predicted AlkP superfamily phosphohydrolase/phosphomutase
MPDAISKVLVVGLDGATFDVIMPWAQAGLLPTLARLLQNGASGPLHSVLPPYTAQAWTTLTTGVNAGRHRLYDFWERDFATGGFRLTNASRRAAPAVWSLLSQAGRRVVVANVPMTYPPEPVNGAFISGRDTPGLNSVYTYPPALKAELECWCVQQRLRYIIVPDDWRAIQQGNPAAALDELLAEADVRFRSARYLLSSREWDFAMLVTGATDGAGHFFWKYHDANHPLHADAHDSALGNALLRVYQRVDERLGELLNELPADVFTMIVSDHGSGSEPDYALHLNLFLAEHGWLKFADAPQNLRQWAKSAALGGLNLGKKIAQRMLPFQALTRLRMLWPDALRTRAESGDLFAGIDWARTAAYSEERRGNIWINLRGRDTQGIVSASAEYERLRDDIIAALGVLKHPLTGEPIIARVWRREELFSGEYAHLLPDIMVEAHSPAIFRRHKDRRAPALRTLGLDEYRRLHTNGNHRMDGILIAHGPGVRAGGQVAGAQLADVAATVLYASGLPIPTDWDGYPLLSLFSDEWRAAHAPLGSGGTSANAVSGAETAYTAEEARQIEERLAGLGYMD